MYRNFICYRGGSSAGILFAEDIYYRLRDEEKIVGKTYYSLCKEDAAEIRNFLDDPKKNLADVENFIMLLTKDFLDGFIIDDEPNEDSVTRIEIDEALKNPRVKFIPIVFPDFSWENETNGRINKRIISELWGFESMRRIVGAPPIQFVFRFKEQVIEQILVELDSEGLLKKVDTLMSDQTFKLESTPSVIPKSIFCGREEELAKIKQHFDSGERILFLQGIGGIGKTEIAKQFAKQNKTDYDTIIYATYNDTIVELVSSQVSFKITPFFQRKVLPDGTQESALSFFNRKLSLIRDITNERTLIIIDNFDVMDDEHFADILNANYRLLITTRFDYSKLYPTLKIKPLASMTQLKNIFLKNYSGYFVNENDEHLEELIEMVNRHTYTIELIAQHMENSGQTVAEMIDILKNEGIISLNEEVFYSVDKTQLAYENLLKMFKVFNLDDEEKHVLQYLSLMPLSGVDIRDFKTWLDLKSLKVIKSLENRSWIISDSNGIALHPIIRDVVRFELPLHAIDAVPFLKAFNETIGEKKAWHYPIAVKNYYADIAAEIISVFNTINEQTEELYRNVEKLFSFAVKPERSAILAADIYRYCCNQYGENCFASGEAAFYAGWTYLFNLQLPDALKNAHEWLLRSHKILRQVELTTIDHFAIYGHLLTHIARMYLLMAEENKAVTVISTAEKYAKEAVDNAEKHLNVGTSFYPRLAVAYMQLAEVYIAAKRYDEALPLANDAYDIMFSIFGREDLDTLNVSSRKSAVLYYLGRYSEALEIGAKNLDIYTRFNGELNYHRFEQLIIVLRCHIKLGNTEEAESLKEYALKIGKQLFSEDAKQLEDLQRSDRNIPSPSLRKEPRS